jgi:hypothetical protein
MIARRGSTVEFTIRYDTEYTIEEDCLREFLDKLENMGLDELASLVKITTNDTRDEFRIDKQPNIAMPIG